MRTSVYRQIDYLPSLTLDQLILPTDPVYGGPYSVSNIDYPAKIGFLKQLDYSRARLNYAYTDSADAGFYAYKATPYNYALGSLFADDDQNEGVLELKNGTNVSNILLRGNNLSYFKKALCVGANGNYLSGSIFEVHGQFYLNGGTASSYIFSNNLTIQPDIYSGTILALGHETINFKTDESTVVSLQDFYSEYDGYMSTIADSVLDGTLTDALISDLVDYSAAGISSGQLDYVADMDQSVASDGNVTFTQLKLTNNSGELENIITHVYNDSTEATSRAGTTNVRYEIIGNTLFLYFNSNIKIGSSGDSGMVFNRISIDFGDELNSAYGSTISILDSGNILQSGSYTIDTPTDITSPSDTGFCTVSAYDDFGPEDGNNIILMETRDIFDHEIQDVTMVAPAGDVYLKLNCVAIVPISIS